MPSPAPGRHRTQHLGLHLGARPDGPPGLRGSLMGPHFLEEDHRGYISLHRLGEDVCLIVVGDDDGRSGSMRPSPGDESLRAAAPRGTWEQVEQVWQSTLSEYEASYRDGEVHEEA